MCKLCKRLPCKEGRKHCADCLVKLSEKSRAHYLRNRQKIADDPRSRFLSNNNGFVGLAQKTRYGITWDEYLDMAEKQGGLCAICDKPESAKGSHGQVKNLAVDHDHITGMVRGLLCNNCNRAIGLLGDDPIRIAKAVAYLQDGVL